MGLRNGAASEESNRVTSNPPERAAPPGPAIPLWERTLHVPWHSAQARGLTHGARRSRAPGKHTGGAAAGSRAAEEEEVGPDVKVRKTLIMPEKTRYTTVYTGCFHLR